MVKVGKSDVIFLLTQMNNPPKIYLIIIFANNFAVLLCSIHLIIKGV